MHREYHPADLEHLRAHAFGDHHGHASRTHDHHAQDHDDRRGLYGLTALLGALLAADLALGWLGWDFGPGRSGVSLALVAAVVGGVRIVYGALDALRHGRIGADVALAQACLAALVIGEPFVAAEVVFIALVGEVLEAVTFDRAQRALRRLVEQAPRTARVRREGQETEIPAAEVVVGEVVIVRPGERVAVDGPVLAGRSTVDQSALTGESIPIDKGPGDPVYSGTLNQFGAIEVRAEKVGHESSIGQVLRLVAEARRRKAPLERAADRLARWFLPVVEAVAGLTLLAGWLFGWSDVWHRAVAVLVVACPCALVLATPAAVLAATAWLARHGVLLKGGVALERLAGCDVFAFDKTGTLTFGRPEVAAVVPLGDLNELELLRLAATAESKSEHPLARAVAREAEARGVAPLPVVEAQSHPGAGVSATYRVGESRERSLLVGNRRLVAERGVETPAEALAAMEASDARGETPLLVADEGLLVGFIAARDAVRPEAHDVVHDLKHLGIRQVALLTGDRPSAALLVAKRTHIKTVEAELLPAEKARWVEDAQETGRRVAMVGDGVNDAPALAAAQVGIALAGVGSDLAAEAGDVLVLGEPIVHLPELVRLSRATVRVIRQNIIVFAIGLNAAAMASASLGILGPVAAAVLHQAGSLLVLLNSMRLLAFGDWAERFPVRQLRSAGATIARIDDRLDPGLVLEWLATRWRYGFVALGSLGTLAWATWGFTAIGPGEVGLLRRFGRFQCVLSPGLHLRLPPPFETVTRIEPGRVRGVSIGFRAIGDGPTGFDWSSGHGRSVAARAEGESLLMTGDGQLVELSATAQYRVRGDDSAALRAYAFGAANPDDAVRPLAESAVREVVARVRLEPLLTADRAAAEITSAKGLQSRLDAAGLGLEVVAVVFLDVHPPVAVLDAYRDVSRAGSERLRRRNEARAIQAEALADARGRAASVVNRAEADRETRLARATGEADAFRYRAAARAEHASLNDRALYWATIARALADRPKLVLEPNKGQPPRLFLTDPSNTGLPPTPLLNPSIAPNSNPPGAMR
jgi:Cu+-exporting ATPase